MLTELPKMPKTNSIDPTNEKDLWLALFNAETEEELEELSQTGGAVMGEAIQAYRGITATEEFKQLEWLRERIRHDEAQALNNAARKRDAHWQAIVDEKEAENAELRNQLEKFRKLVDGND